jgi:lipopolysaccharide/colanic/teichoic acid biosynthesis glycosyltransferase
VISTDLPSGVPWVNQHGETGLVVPPGDSAALRASIETLAADPALRSRMGERGRARVLAHFTIPRMVEQTTALYRTLTDRPIPQTEQAMAHRTQPSPPFDSAGSHRRVSIPAGKRALDVVLSGLGLLASAPLWLAIAAAIKTEDGGPVFYTQDRVGEGGRVFKVFKFRSMIPNAEAVVGAVQAAENDPRVTRIGRLLRATAMDELPQLLNIFRGDMSFVGPRALRPGEIEAGAGGELVAIDEIAGYAERQQIRPGLTGIAQIYVPRDVSRRQKFRYDGLYARQQSFSLDVRLILLSFWITLRGRWEDRTSKF